MKNPAEKMANFHRKTEVRDWYAGPEQSGIVIASLLPLFYIGGRDGGEKNSG